MQVLVAVVCITVLSGAIGQREVLPETETVVSQCPRPNGWFPDAVQCDKYYECKDSIITEKLCDDGFVFNELNSRVEKCDFPFATSCEGRPELQPAKPSANCPRQNGYFPDTNNACTEFHYCTQANANKLTCPETLVFSTKSGTCVWPAEAGRADCVAKKLYNFDCPLEDAQVAAGNPRYADPEDCQYFYVCVTGIDPRRNGCGFGTVFDSNTKSCGSPADVPECKDYYTKYFENYFTTLEVTGGNPAADIVTAAIAAGFKTAEELRPQRITGINNPNSARRKISPEQAAADKVLALENAVQLDIAPPRLRGVLDNPDRPVRRRQRPAAGAKPLRRRRPQRKRTTTTTTTTEAPPAEEDYYYYYDDEEPLPADDTAALAARAPVRAPVRAPATSA